MKHPLSCDELKRLVDYDPNTGLFVWRKRPQSMFANQNAFGSWNTRFADKPAFWKVDGSGYHVSKLFGREYKAHRVALCIVNGSWPPDEVDHINKDRTDNRLCNLREATHAENMRNRTGGHGKFGLKGVRFKHGKFAAVGTDSKGKRKWLGTFNCPTSAAIAYNLFALKEHGEFARSNE